MSTSGGSGGGGLSVATANLQNAQIAQVFSDPHEIIAAPGANRVIYVIEIVYEYVAGVTSYTAGDAGLFYSGLVTAPQRINAPTTPIPALNASAPTSIVNTGEIPAPLQFPTATIANVGVVISKPTANPDRQGPVATSTLAAGGAGYVIGDTGTIDTDIYGGGAAYVVDTVGALGVVLTYHLTAAGTGYSIFDNPLPTTAGGAQPGIGTGLTVNVTAVAAADGILYVTVYYAIITTH